MIKTYFRGGDGLKNPVDVNGKPISEGDILTHCWFENDYIEFFQKQIGVDDINEIEKRVHKPSVIVKINEDGILYGEGINDKLYMHDFRFKYTKKLN